MCNSSFLDCCDGIYTSFPFRYTLQFEGIVNGDRKLMLNHCRMLHGVRMVWRSTWLLAELVAPTLGVRCNSGLVLSGMTKPFDNAVGQLSNCQVLETRINREY